MQAVQKLLMIDTMFRNKDFEKRRMINRYYEQVKKFGG